MAVDIVKELHSAQERFTEKLNEFHKVALLPIADEKTQADAVNYYGVLLASLLDYVGHMRKYYSDRPVVLAAVEQVVTTITDKAAKMLDGDKWDDLLK